MENEEIEQLKTEPENVSENSEGSIYGKFKDAKTLLEAYNSLQSEFTRKSQKLADIQKKMEEFAVFSNNDSIDDILKEQDDTDKYKKEITEILDNDNELSSLPNKNHVAFKIIKEAERKTAENLNNPITMSKYLDNNKELKNKLIEEYLSQNNTSSIAPKVITGSSTNIYFSPNLNPPKTLKDAGEIFSKMLK